MMDSKRVLGVDRERGFYVATPAAWQESLVDLIDLHGSAIRNRVANELSDRFTQLNPMDDDETLVGVTIREADREAVEEAFMLAEGAEIEEITYEPPVEESEKGKNGRGLTRPPKNKTRLCECGCGEYTAGGKYRPGHDSRHHSLLLSQSDLGNAEAIDYLIRTGFRTAEQLDKRRAQFQKKKTRNST